MSSIVSNIQNFFSKNSEILKIIVLIILVGIVAYTAKCRYNNESFFMGYHDYPTEGPLDKGNGNEKVDGINEDFRYTGSPDSKQGPLEASDLIPNTQLDGAFEQDRAVLMGNFLSPGINTGLDTIGSALKKTNYALRSIPQIPVNREVSPWNVSTYEPDVYRRPLE